MKKIILLMLILLCSVPCVNSKKYLGITEELFDDYMVCDSIRKIVPYNINTAGSFETTQWLFGLNAIRNLNTNQTDYILVVVIGSFSNKSNNEKLLIRTFDDEVIELTSCDENETVINLGHNVTKGILGNVGTIQSIDHHINKTYFHISEDDILKLQKGIKKVRIGTDSNFNEKSYKKDKAGKKLYEIYLNFDKWFSMPVHKKDMKDDF